MLKAIARRNKLQALYRELKRSQEQQGVKNHAVHCNTTAVTVKTC